MVVFESLCSERRRTLEQTRNWSLGLFEMEMTEITTVLEDSQSGDDLQPQPRNSIQSMGMARYRTQRGDRSTIGMLVEVESGWSASFDYMRCACV